LKSFSGSFRDRIYWSIELGQFRFFQNAEGVPMGFANWASISDSYKDTLIAGEKVDLDKEFWTSGLLDFWTSGKNLFFPEVIAPYGNFKDVVEDLRINLFEPGQVGFWLRGRLDDTAPPKVHWVGYL
jgi:cytolysin-activating lysine-acyltransferase